eukprot:1155511-Pelagomonas_calceolata.AAC.1
MPGTGLVVVQQQKQLQSKERKRGNERKGLHSCTCLPTCLRGQLRGQRGEAKECSKGSEVKRKSACHQANQRKERKGEEGK